MAHKDVGRGLTAKDCFAQVKSRAVKVPSTHHGAKPSPDFNRDFGAVDEVPQHYKIATGEVKDIGCC